MELKVLAQATLQWTYTHVYQPIKCALFPCAVRYVPPGVRVLLSYRERRTLYRYARRATDGTLVEIGCYSGGSTYFLCSGARAGRARVVAIDPFEDSLNEQQRLEDPAFVSTGAVCAAYYATKPRRRDVEAFLRSQGFDNFELVKGFSFDAARQWHGPITLLFIDGNHEYAAVRRDFEEWSPFVEPGGYLLFHDSTSASLWEGPKRLAAEIAGRSGWQMVEAVDTLTVFRKPL